MDAIVNILMSIRTATKDVQSILSDIPADAVGALAEKYSSLNKAQQVVMKSTLQLNADQTELFNTCTKQLQNGTAIAASALTQSDAYNQLSQSAKDAIAAAIQKSAVDQEGTVILKTNALAALDDAVAKGELGAAEAKAYAQTILHTTGVKGNTTALWANVKAQAALMAANPATWIALAVSAISIAVKLYNEYNVTLEEHLDKLDDLKAKYDQTTSELTTVNDEINDIAEKLAALEKVKAPTLVQQEELVRLRKTNKELEIRKALLEAEQKLAQEDYHNELIEAFDKANNVGSTITAQHASGRITGLFSTGSSFVGDLRSTTLEKFGEGIGNYQIGYDQLFDAWAADIATLQRQISELDTQIAEANEAGNTALVNQLGQQRAALESALAFEKGEVTKLVGTFSTYYESIFDQTGGDFSGLSEHLRSIMEQIGEWRSFVANGFHSYESDWQRLTEIPKYDSAVKQLVALAKQGELTEDTLNSADFSGFMNALKNMGIPVDWILAKLRELADVKDEVAGDGESTSSNMQAYIVNNEPVYASSKVSSALGDALDEYNESGVIAAETLQSLESAIPGVTDVLLDANGNWTAAGEAVLAYRNNLHDATIAMYEAVIAQKQLALNQSMEESASDNAVPGKDYAAEQAALQAEITAYQAQLGALHGGWQEAIGTSLNKVTTDVDLLKEAMSDLFDGTFEDWDVEFIDNLLEAFPSLRNELEAFADGTKDAEDVYRECANLLANEFCEALEDVKDACDDYGENSVQVQDALGNLESIIPGVTGLLYDESGGLTDVGQAAIQAAQGNIAAAQSMLKAAIAAAQFDLSNLVAEYNAATAAADANTQANIRAAYSAQIKDAKANIADMEALLEGLNTVSSTGGGGGGGGSSKKKDVLEDYKAQKKILDHRIKMSQAAQDCMSDETDAWEGEQQEQLAIYKEYAALIQQEIERLRALGYENHSEEIMELEDDLASVYKSMYNVAKASWEKQRDAQIKALRKQKEEAEKAHEAEMERLEAEISRQETLISLLETQYDLTNSLRDERQDLEKELAKANSYTGLSDKEREALFSHEDYAQLVGVLDEIESEATIAYNTYLERIKAVNTDEAYKLDYITTEYENQYELMSKKYEIAKQDLAVARARIALENAQQNRNIAMIIDGKWTWAADPEAIEQAMDEIYEAEKEKANAQSEFVQQEKLNAMEMFKASIELQKEAAEAAHEKLMEQIDDLIEALEEMEFAFDECIDGLFEAADAIQDAIAAIRAAASSGGGGGGGWDGWDITDNDPGTGKNDTVAVGGKVISTKGLVNYFKGTFSPDSKISQSQQTKTAISAANQVINSQKQLSAMQKNLLSIQQNTYASAKKAGAPGYSSGGVASFTGTATLHGSNSASEVIFNAKDAAKLYDMIHNGNPAMAMAEAMAKRMGAVTSALQPQAAASTDTSIHYHINGITLGESAGNLTLRDLATQLTSAAPLLR